MAQALSGISEDYMAEHGLLTHAAAAEYIGTSERYLTKLVGLRQIRPVRILNRNLFHRTDLDAFVQEHPGLGSRTQTVTT